MLRFALTLLILTITLVLLTRFAIFVWIMLKVAGH